MVYYHLFLFIYYLARTTSVVGAVVLINDNGIPHILHDDILKFDVADKCSGRSCP